MWEIDEWYIQEQPPTEDCLLYPARCSECIAVRKQCLLNLFTEIHDGKPQEKTQKDRDEYNDKSSKKIKKS